ncbi:putative nucleoporin NDC1 [Trichinella spiralis]|uniref:putative nucleoporin NDC1 n=1 Tax=Trichinella spiralis TaxID=6334 RepID=UPI0001EFEA66|nr:putative nucleoporin NDC1 [Trichinella spiralis]
MVRFLRSTMICNSDLRNSLLQCGAIYNCTLYTNDSCANGNAFLYLIAPNCFKCFVKNYSLGHPVVFWKDRLFGVGMFTVSNIVLDIAMAFVVKLCFSPFYTENSGFYIVLGTLLTSVMASFYFFKEGHHFLSFDNIANNKNTIQLVNKDKDEFLGIVVSLVKIVVITNTISVIFDWSISDRGFIGCCRLPSVVAIWIVFGGFFRRKLLAQICPVVLMEALSFEIPGPRKSSVDNSKLYLTDILKIQQPNILKLLAFIYTEMLTRRVSTCRTLMRFNEPGYVPYLWISIRDVCFSVLGDFYDFIVEEKYSHVLERSTTQGENVNNSSIVSKRKFDGSVDGRKQDETLKGKIRSEICIPGALKFLPPWWRQFCTILLYGVSPKVYNDYQLVMWAAKILTNAVCLSMDENSLSVVQLDANRIIEFLKNLNAALNYYIEVPVRRFGNVRRRERNDRLLLESHHRDYG